VMLTLKDMSCEILYDTSSFVECSWTTGDSKFRGSSGKGKSPKFKKSIVMPCVTTLKVT
jgi:hypothetical protein